MVKLLVVEDDRQIRKLMSTTLSSNEYSIECACDGGQSEEEYRTEYGIKPVAFEQLGGGIANLSVGGHSARIDGGVFFHKMCVFWNAKIHIFSDMDKKT